MYLFQRHFGSNYLDRSKISIKNSSLLFKHQRMICLPVTSRSPVPSCFRTMTLLPLWTPARTMAMVPGVKLGFNERACFLKRFLEVPLAGLKNYREKLIKIWKAELDCVSFKKESGNDVGFICVSVGTSYIQGSSFKYL